MQKLAYVINVRGYDVLTLKTEHSVIFSKPKPDAMLRISFVAVLCWQFQQRPYARPFLGR